MAADDEPLYLGLYNSIDVMRHVAPPLSAAAGRHAFMLALAQTVESPPRAHYWVCHDLEQAQDLGLLALVHDRGCRASAEIGMLLPPAAQGHGFASEALATVVAHAFARLEVCRIWTRHKREHAAADALMRRLGFRSGDTIGDESRWTLCKDDMQADRERDPGFALGRECG